MTRAKASTTATEENELSNIRHEMGRLADCLDELGDELDSGAVCQMLRCLLDGNTADSIISEHGLLNDGA